MASSIRPAPQKVPMSALYVMMSGQIPSPLIFCRMSMDSWSFPDLPNTMRSELYVTRLGLCPDLRIVVRISSAASIRLDFSFCDNTSSNRTPQPPSSRTKSLMREMNSMFSCWRVELSRPARVLRVLSILFAFLHIPRRIFDITRLCLIPSLSICSSIFAKYSKFLFWAK